MKHWQTVIVGPQTRMEDAIAAMDRGALRIAIVADEERRLLGTLTDGDVRRALLRHQSLDTPVGEVMCATPMMGQQGWSRERMRAVMESRQLLQLPIVDDRGVVVGLETLHSVLEQRHLPNKVFLMAGGFGTRLHPLTQDCPKPLLKVGDKPILELILDSFIRCGFHDFFFSTHYLPEMIRDYFGDGRQWGVRIRYVHEEDPLGTGGALGLLPHEEIDAPILMMNGDLLTTVDYESLLEFHVQQGSSATMCVRSYEHQIPFGVVRSDGHVLRTIEEKPTQKVFINAGIYALSEEFVRRVRPGTRVDMPTLLNQALARGESVATFPVHENWLDIGRMEDFKRAQEMVNSLGRA